MKFYCRNTLLNRVEAQKYDLLMGVKILTRGRGYIRKENWGDGWIYDSDESFQSWCAIAYGFEPVKILDEEFKLLDTVGVVFLSKERTLELNKLIKSQIDLIQHK